MNNTKSYDSALEDFLLRFGEQNTSRERATAINIEKQGMNNVGLQADTSGLTFQEKAKSGNSKFGDIMSNQNTYAGLAAGASSMMARYSSLPENASNDEKEQAAMASIKDGVATAIPIAGMFKQVEEGGKQMGESWGVGAGGFTAGFLDPLSTIQSDDSNWGEKMIAADPLTAGIIEMGHAKKRARKKREEQNKLNLKESALEKAEREQDYIMEQGLASLQSLKYLRQKQLGITS